MFKKVNHLHNPAAVACVRTSLFVNFMRRIIGLGLLLVVVFSLSACVVPNIELNNYKATTKNDLTAYAEAKGESNYSEEAWAAIQAIVDDSKNAIDVATSRAGVDSARKAAETDIDAVEQKEVNNLEWTNENAVYAYIKAGHETEILNDVEGAFNQLSFQKVYVSEKNINVWTPLALLFILKDDEKEKQQEFVEILKQDTRINHASRSRDLPFKTVDTRHIEHVKSTIAVGETLTLRAKGNIDYYVQPFEFEGLFIKPVTSKIYTVADFPKVDLKSVKAKDSGWLYLELTTKSYFEVIKAVDVLSRLPSIEKVEFDKSELVSVIPPIWQISESSVAVFESTVGGGYPTAVIKGLKPGKATVDYGGVNCEITVI